MSKSLSILACQLNPVVGDVSGNLALAEAMLDQAKSESIDLVVLSEFFILGYPAEDLVLKPSAVRASMRAIESLAALTRDGPAIILGGPWADGEKLHNSAFFLSNGEITLRYDKRHLPNYGVFDEKRLFDAGTGDHKIVRFKDAKIGIAICEEHPRTTDPRKSRSLSSHP
ncbi:MAG: nitrilase-related carbon-nitrogen hydrolase [Pseudomonadota bacterium]